MRDQLIHKHDAGWRVKPWLTDLAAERERFTWAALRSQLLGSAAGGVNIAQLALDRHAGTAVAGRDALRFVAADGEGFDPDWLRAVPLEVRARGGGERFKPHPTRPSKTLKRLFQDAGIAEFDRGALPLVWRADRLIFVAGLGPDVRLIDADGPRIALHWQPNADLIGPG
jgi:tRNA(Ile)-lysidine synthetase-like protein